MRATWLVAIAAGAALSASAPAELLAQGNSQRARQQQQERQRPQQVRVRQQENARERERREQELQRQREQQRQTELRRQQELQRRAAAVLRPNDRDRRDRDDRYDRDRWDDRRYDRRYDDRWDRRGPPFCRSGQGHPVHGRQWCRSKGYGLGNERARDVWGDIIFRQPRDRRYDDRSLGRSVLGDILGSVVLGRFDSYGRTYYGSNAGSLNGRWLDSRGSAMQLYMGGIPIARLIDTNRDGRVDDVILTR